jgi:hypothetical protein
MSSFDFCKECPAKVTPEAGHFEDSANRFAEVDVRGYEGNFFLGASFGDYTGATVQDGERTISFFGGGGDVSHAAQRDPRVAEAFRGCSQIEKALEITPTLLSEEARIQRSMSCAAIHAAFPELTPEALFKAFNEPVNRGA